MLNLTLNELIDILKEDKEIKEWFDKHKEFEKKLRELKTVFKVKMASETLEFVLQRVSWKGQKVIRDVPKTYYVLRLGSKDDFDSFILSDNPIVFYPVGAVKEPKRDKKFWDYEGSLPPRTDYNPNKELEAEMKILDKGKVNVNIVRRTPLVAVLEFKGKNLKGNWSLEQESKGSEYFYLNYIGEMNEEELIESSFSLVKRKSVYVLNVQMGVNEWLWIIMLDNPIDKPIEDLQTVRTKIQEDEFSGEVIDKGDVSILNISQVFMSFVFHGEELKGYYILKEYDGKLKFGKSSLPKGLSEPKPLDDIEVETHKNYTIYWIYDARDFHKCENYRKYLKIEVPKWVLDIGVCTYTVPQSIPHLKVVYVITDNSVEPEKVKKWIREQGLVELDFIQIRG